MNVEIKTLNVPLLYIEVSQIPDWSSIIIKFLRKRISELITHPYNLLRGSVREL